MKKLALFLLLILSCGSSFAVSFAQLKNALRFAGFSGTTFAAAMDLYGKYLDKDKVAVGKQVNKDYQDRVMTKLYSFYDRGLLNFHPSDVAIESSDEFAANRVFKPRLFVDENQKPNEFTLLHEGLHLNERHSAVRLVSNYLAFALSFASRRPIRSLIAFPAFTNFALGKIFEHRADSFASRNCSNYGDIECKAKDCYNHELDLISGWEKVIPFSFVAKFTHYLIDPHAPLVGYRSDRLVSIYRERLEMDAKKRQAKLNKDFHNTLASKIINLSQVKAKKKDIESMIEKRNELVEKTGLNDDIKDLDMELQELLNLNLQHEIEILSNLIAMKDLAKKLQR